MGHAGLVDGAHVIDIDAMLGDFLALAVIDRADADLEDVLRIDHRAVLIEDRRKFRLTAEKGHRHAVHVARRRCRW
jgi:hypothetical protein